MRRTISERNILFLCEDNAGLSQMAEAFAKHLSPPKTRILSAGMKPGAIPLHVVQAMQELGVSMRGQNSKTLSAVPIDEIDLVVSFNGAHRHCANLLGRAKIDDWTIPDARSYGADPAPSLTSIREHRDEIETRVFALFLDHWRNVA